MRLDPIELDRVSARAVNDHDRELRSSVSVDVRRSEDPASREAVDGTEDLWLRSGAKIPDVEA